ncbi:MAG TPA: DNA-deoxyinosine glycosylase [Eubacteriales bacterium]|mgnify:CR=1 FL=1|nr:DNA-deoxyinosine glycosylase [Eubacteriales bacterium]
MIKNPKANENTLIDGFEPFYNENSLILILGSFPSVKSREVSFYYGNKQNRFWKMLSDFFGMPIHSIAEKKKLLSVNEIALWDIVTKCEIIGSLDSAIKNYSVADVPSLLVNAPNIKKILINGQTAYKIFTKNFPELSDIAICLPSTSPANTKFDKSAWLKELEILKKTN